MSRCDGPHSADHGGGAGHVIFHLFHAISGFDGDAAGIKSDAFPNQAQHRSRGRIRRFVSQYDQRGRFVRALGDAPEGPHLQFFDLSAPYASNFQSGFLRHFAGALRQDSWRHAVAGLVHQFASEILRLADDAGFIHRLLQSGLVSARNHSHGVDLLILAVALVGVGIEVTDESSFHNGLYGFVALNIFGSQKGETANTLRLEEADCCAGKFAQLGAVKFLALPPPSSSRRFAFSFAGRCSSVVSNIFPVTSPLAITSAVTSLMAAVTGFDADFGFIF